MKTMEIQERRPIAPNVKMVSNRVFHQFAAWFRAGLGLGLMLFVALTTFSFLSHGMNLLEGSAKQGLLRDPGQGFSPVLPKAVPAAPVRVIRSTVAVQKSQDDYRMFREQARFVTDLSESASRMVSRLAR
ncbi:MAG: hypothetical protein V1882_12855 [Candidatus Omnitrophota bacterium]